MKRPFLLLGLILLAALTLVACGASITSTSPTAGSYTEADDGATLQLAKGDTFDVYLPMEKDSEEYWQIGSIDDADIQPDGKPVLTHGDEGDRIQLRFKAVKVGETTLTLIYLKEGDRLPQKSFSLKVAVVEK